MDAKSLNYRNKDKRQLGRMQPKALRQIAAKLIVQNPNHPPREWLPAKYGSELL